MALTVLSQNEFNIIAKTHMTSEEAYKHLNENVRIRTFAETLRKLTDERGNEGLLIDRLCRYMTLLSRESISKKVRGWLKGKYEPADRETYFQICFALNLNETEAQRFLSVTSDSGFHYRNPRELVYAFALKTNMSYEEAGALLRKLPELPDVKEYKTVYTETILSEFIKVGTTEEFIRFYNDNLYKLGVLHNTAYRYFSEFMSVLAEPDIGLQDCIDIKEERFSIEKIVEKYLRMSVPGDMKSRKLSYIQKTVKKYWPSATSVKNMFNRSEDVKRKTLILLYLITEGIIDYVPYENIIDEELTDEEIFSEHFYRINYMLSECGFALLDPVNAFDWIVLYAVKMNNSDIMADEMQMIINRVFDLPQGNKTD